MVTIGAIFSDTFQFMRRNVRAIAVWAGAYALFAALMQLAMPMPAIDPQTQPAAFWAAFAPRFAISLIAIMVFYAACLRAVMRPADDRAYYLRLGMDELRLFGLTLMVGIGFMVVWLLGVVVLVFLAGMLSALGSVGKVFGVIAAFAILPLLCALLYVVVRLSPAWPLTILRRRIILDEAWDLARGRFWTLFGSYFLVYLAFFLIGMLFLALFQRPVLDGIFHPMDPEAQARLQAFQQAQLAMAAGPRAMLAAVSGLVMGVLLAFHVGVFGCATRLLLAEREQAAASSHDGPWGQKIGASE